PMAAVASIAQRAPLLKQSLPGGKAAPDSPLRRQWERSVAQVRLACGPEVNKLLPPDGVDFTDFYSSKEGQITAEKLQKALTVLAEKQRRSSLETKLSLEQKRVLQSSSGKWASYLLTTFPSSPA